MSEYVNDLNKKLAAARARVRQGNEIKQLKAAAPTLFEIIDGEISLEINKAFGDKPLGYEEYLESHGAVRGIKRIRNLLNAKETDEVQASQEVEALQKEVERTNGQKQK